MPWFKVDDKLHDHRKARAAKKAAMGVWVLAGSWSADNLTNGFVPESVLSRWGTRRDAAVLVEVGLWAPCDQNGEAGWRFHEWTERQPTREQVEIERAAARERMANRRQNRRNSSPEVRANNSRSSVDVREPRPDPTRPDPVVPDGTTPSGGADKPRRPTRRTRIPDDFRPSEDHVKLAADLGVDLRAEWPKFCDHWRGNGETKADWSATLRNWIRKAAEYGGARGQVVPTRPRRLLEAHEIEEPPDGLSPAEYATWEREQRERRRA